MSLALGGPAPAGGGHIQPPTPMACVSAEEACGRLTEALGKPSYGPCAGELTPFILSDVISVCWKLMEETQFILSIATLRTGCCQ